MKVTFGAEGIALETEGICELVYLEHVLRLKDDHDVALAVRRGRSIAVVRGPDDTEVTNVIQDASDLSEMCVSISTLLGHTGIPDATKLRIIGERIREAQERIQGRNQRSGEKGSPT